MHSGNKIIFCFTIQRKIHLNILQYLIHFSRTSLTNLGLGFSGSTVKQSALYRGHTITLSVVLFKQWVYPIKKKKKLSVSRITHQSSQLHRNWKLLKWWENQLISLEIQISLLCTSQTGTSKSKSAVRLPVYTGGVHGVQPHVEHLCGLGQLTVSC